MQRRAACSVQSSVQLLLFFLWAAGFSFAIEQWHTDSRAKTNSGNCLLFWAVTAVFFCTADLGFVSDSWCNVGEVYWSFDGGGGGAQVTAGAPGQTWRIRGGGRVGAGIDRTPSTETTTSQHQRPVHTTTNWTGNYWNWSRRFYRGYVACEADIHQFVVINLTSTAEYPTRNTTLLWRWINVSDVDSSSQQRRVPGEQRRLWSK